MEKDALVIENLVKSYGTVHAVNDISFRVEKGSLFALCWGFFQTGLE